eukprot:255920_1
MMAQTNSHLRSLLQVKSLLNDTQDNVLSSCIQRLFDIFGSNRNILEILIKCSTETQLNTMKNVIEEAIAVTNKVGASKHSQHNFCQISNPSISNIISFLNKDDIKQFKLTSIRIGILCLEIMDTKPHKIINIMCSKPNISLISTASFISKINERGLLVQQWNKHANDITSKGQSYIMQASANKCDTTNIEQCGCIERLTIIFSYVNKWNLDDIDSILHIFEHLNKYSVQEFVNDLDHIRQHHDTLVNQQLFCKKINYCDRIKCNFQDRSSMIRTIEHSVFNNQIHEETFSHFKFIQEAHLYLFHSLPITYNYNSNGRHEIQRLIKEYNDYNAHRSNRFVDQHHNRNDTCSNHNDSPTASHSPKTSKTIQIIDTSILMDDCIEDEKEYKQDLETISSPLFSYGNRFEYNPHKNCKKNPYYVGCAYENLKKELLDDMNKKFNIKQWNSLIHTSSTLFEMPFSKQLKSNNNKNKCISKGRILAIRLYCSHGTLASALKKTYRESKIKTKAQQKRQHSKFGHWARLLSTTCDLFGINMTQEHNCYRGLNDVYIFKSGFSCKLYGPISTTRQLAVASAFAGNGIILKIEKASFCSNAKFFECNPYSNYKSEHELLFDGHSNYLDVTGIYTSSIGTVHAQYDTKPVLLLQALTSKCNIDIGILIRLAPYITKKLCKLLKRYIVVIYSEKQKQIETFLNNNIQQAIDNTCIDSGLKAMYKCAKSSRNVLKNINNKKDIEGEVEADNDNQTDIQIEQKYDNNDNDTISIDEEDIVITLQMTTPQNNHDTQNDVNNEGNNQEYNNDEAGKLTDLDIDQMVSILEEISDENAYNKIKSASISTLKKLKKRKQIGNIKNLEDKSEHLLDTDNHNDDDALYDKHAAMKQDFAAVSQFK